MQELVPSLKAQMKYAGKMGCKKVLIVGDDELASGQMTLKNMENGEQTTVTPDTLEKEI